MDPCDRYEPLVGALADQELEPDRAREVRRHLEGCPGCRALERDLAAMTAIWAKRPDPPVPRAALDDRILAILPVAPARPRLRYSGPASGVVAAAAAFVALSLAFPAAPVRPSPGPADREADHAHLEAFLESTARGEAVLEPGWPTIHAGIERHFLETEGEEPR